MAALMNTRTGKVAQVEGANAPLAAPQGPPRNHMMPVVQPPCPRPVLHGGHGTLRDAFSRKRTPAPPKRNRIAPVVHRAPRRGGVFQDEKSPPGETTGD